MNTNSCLLAKAKPKSGDVPLEITLIGHTRCVLAAVDALFVKEGGPSRLAQSWLRFFGLTEGDFGRFLRHLRVAAAAHDWGKANDGFQDQVATRGDQVFRHEHLSALFLVAPGLKDRLQAAGIDDAAILAAVLSHHVKCSYKSLGNPFPGTRKSISILWDHEDFLTLWKMIESEIGGRSQAVPSVPKRLSVDDSDDLWEELRRNLSSEQSRLRGDLARRRFLAALRSALIVCDSLGSAVPRMPGELNEWVRLAFRDQMTGAKVWDQV